FLEQRLEELASLGIAVRVQQMLREPFASGEMLRIAANRIAIILSRLVRVAHALPHHPAQVKRLTIARRVSQPALEAALRFAEPIGVEEAERHRFEDERRFGAIGVGAEPEHL